jgi:hypothetical protein
VADGLGGVPGAIEVAVFEREVGGDEEVVVGRGFEDGAVVTDAEAEGAREGGGGAAADAVDEIKFAGDFVAAGMFFVRHRFQSKWGAESLAGEGSRVATGGPSPLRWLRRSLAGVSGIQTGVHWPAV